MKRIPSGRPVDPQDWSRLPAQACWVAVLDHCREARDLRLAPYQTRCVLAGHIHEVIGTDEEVGSDRVVQRVFYLGFARFTEGAVIAVGDLLISKHRTIGQVVGFGEAHMPNHLNIVVFSSKRSSGIDLGLRPMQIVHFCPKHRWSADDAYS